MALRATKCDENTGARRPESPPQARCLPHCCPATAVEVVWQEVFDGAPPSLSLVIEQQGARL